MANPFVHVELNSTDIAKSKEFYGNLFDWKLEDVPMGDGTNYTMVGVGEGIGGGMFSLPGGPSHWLPYMLVDDIEASTAKAKSLGAKIIKDVTETMGMGWLSILMDPNGATFGLWKPAPRSKQG